MNASHYVNLPQSFTVGLLLLCMQGCSDDGGGLPYGLAQQVPLEESVVLGADTASPGETVGVINAFPKLRFNQPVDFARVPGLDYSVVVEQPGTVRIFRNNSSEDRTETFLNLTDRVDYPSGEQGLIRIAFDPAYISNGRVYVTYAGKSFVDPRCASNCSVISRFTRSASNPLRLDLSSEEIVLVLEQPFDTHNIGNLVFGPDGYLYVGVGDGGSTLPLRIDAQDRTNLYGTVLRIDVSGPGEYRIPADNPFVGVGLESPGVVGAGKPVREEIWAYGLRNPHRFSIDAMTGRMWLGDVGENMREEINEIVAGGNYGWPAFEGSYNRRRNDIGRSESAYTPPVLEYARSEGTSVTGGFVYRGAAVPQIAGQYIFGDFVAGTIWSFDPNSNENPRSKTVVTQSAGGFGVAGFSEVDDEIYIVSLGGGTIQRLVDARLDARVVAPARLSETGLFSDLRNLVTMPSLIPYAVNAELWSDGAVKQRWFALPGKSKIRFDPELPWSFPLGTVLVKHFEIDLDEIDIDNPLTRLETRVLINTHGGWRGFTYRWNAEQSDATLVERRTRMRLDLRTKEGVIEISHQLPSSADCGICHNASAGYVLGLGTAQINSVYNYPLAEDNQLRTLGHLNIFEPRPGAPESYPATASPTDERLSLEARARSYLAANCAQCHNANNRLNTDIDLRSGIPNDQTNTIDRRPQTSDLGIANSRIIASGDRARSTLWRRMQGRGSGTGQMPPLGTYVVDDEAVALIGAWIDSLPDGQ